MRHAAWSISLAASTALLFALGTARVEAQGKDAAIKIGVLSDMSGTFSDQAGKVSLVAAQMAAEEFGNAVLGRPVAILSGDHQNKADIASGIAGQWYDVDGVSLVVDTPNSSTALAVQEVARQKNKINIVSTAGSIALTGKSCSPTGFHWMWDTYSNSFGLVKALGKRQYDTWYFITADYAFGTALETDFRKAIDATGGKTLGSIKHPVNAPDFSSQILSAQSSGAKAVILANGGNDIVNSVKSAREFGLQKAGQTLIAPATFLTDVKGLGLEAAQGLTYIDGFYWDYDDASRAFAKKFFDKHGAMPTMGQAGVYSAVRHYLASVKDAGTTDSQAVAKKMRETPVEDAVVRHGQIRADGRLVHDMYLAQVKKPEESKGPWDLERILATISGAEMFRPLAESDCPLVTK